MIVLDASAVVCLLTQVSEEQHRALSSRVRGELLHAPHLLDLETTQTIRRMVLAGALTAAAGRAVLTDLSALRLVRHPHYPYLSRIWELRSNLTAYDAAYVALAEALGAPLLTLDGRMARAGSSASIETF